MTDEERKKIEDERLKWPTGHCVCERREAGPHEATTLSLSETHYIARIQCRVCPKTWKRISYRQAVAA